MNRTCGFCQKTCTDPKFLPCLHGFCKACLNFQITKVPTNRQWEGFSCPFCKIYTKAIDPEEPLHLWVEQFPDRPRVPRKASEPILHGTHRAGEPADRRKSLSDDDASKRTSPRCRSPTSESKFICIPPSADSAKSLSVASEPLSPLSKTRSSLSSGTSSISDSGPSKLLSVSESVEDPDSEDVFVIADGVDAMTTTEQNPVVESANGHEEQMCMMHPWKPVVIKCTKCDAVACGLCLTESHTTCSGQHFSPLSGVSLLPDLTEMETEVQKVNSVNEAITSSSARLQNTRKALHEKIKRMTWQMIQDIRKEEQDMVKKIQQLYRTETSRLKAEIHPSQDLLKEVQQLKKETEELTTHHFTDMLQNSDTMLARQRTLVIGLKAVDVTCIPPEVEFVRKWDAIDINLGEIVVDPGFYPKHDVSEEQLNIADTTELPQTVAGENVKKEVFRSTPIGKGPTSLETPEMQKTLSLPQPFRQGASGPSIHPATADKSTAKTMTIPASLARPAQPTAGDAATPPGPKTKSATLMSRLFSPKQGQRPEKTNPKQEKGKSKFYVKNSTDT